VKYLLLVLLVLSGCGFLTAVDPNEPTFTQEPWRFKYTPISVEYPGEIHRIMTYATDLFPCDLFERYHGPGIPNITIRYSDLDEEVTKLFLSGHVGPTELPACKGQVVEATDDASTYLCRDGTAEIWIRYNRVASDSTEAMLFLGHELGHALGLAHDPGITLMSPDAVHHAERLDQGLMLPLLSFADEAALKNRYCKE